MNDLTEARREALAIEGEAWKLIKAFDDETDKLQPVDRRVPYAAMIIMMTAFIKTSRVAEADVIMDDFRNRVLMGVDTPGGWVG